MKSFREFIVDSGRWGVASEMAALVAFAVGLYEHLRNHEISAFTLIATSVVLFWLGAFCAWSKLNRRLEEIDKAKPSIKAKLPGAVHVVMVQHTFFDKGTGKVMQNHCVPFIRVTLHNDPLHSLPGSVAKGVRAYIKFFPIAQSVPCLSIDGRWVETDQPPAFSPLQSTVSLLETSFGIGESHIVDIAYISGADDRCYAWNNDNYSNFNQLYVTPQHLLELASYEVHVRIRGEFVDETFKFEFERVSNGFKFTQPS